MPCGPFIGRCALEKSRPLVSLRQTRLPLPEMSTWLGRAWTVLGGVSIRTKIMGIVLALTVALGLGVTWQVRSVMERVFFAELDSRGRSVASDLAARSVDPLLLNDLYGLHQLLKETVANHPDALYGFVRDREGQVLAHTFGSDGFPVALLSLPDPQNLADGILVTRFDSSQGIIHDFAAPIFEGRAGVLHLGLTETRLHSVVNTVTGQMLLTTLAVAVAGILAALFLTWLLTQPILQLVESTQEVGRGNLQARAPHWADDEIGALADAFNQMVQDLEVSRQAIVEKDAARSRLLEQLITAQEEERKRISRELHDGVGQALSSLMVGMKVIAQLDDPAQIRQRTEALRQMAAQTLEEVRLLSRQLRPSVLDDLGLEAALERYVGEFQQLYPDIQVDLHVALGHRLPPTHEIILYRILQEAMTNAARHSGCNTLSVLIQQRSDHVQAIVEDDGHGFDPVAAQREGRSVGIHGMTERAELVGGTLEIESSPDGTAIYVALPLPAGRL